MNIISPQERHKKALEYASNQILKWNYAKEIQSIYLFGSCSRGEQGYDSDVDIYIICSPNIPKSALRQLKIMVLPEDPTLPDVEVKFGFKSLDEEDDLFHKNIKKDGILLWQKKN